MNTGSRESPRKPLRVWLEVGENDNGSHRDEASLHNWVLANQRMAAALKAKGYPCRFVFAQGAGHVDRRVVRQTLPAALEWLWQGYPISASRIARPGADLKTTLDQALTGPLPPAMSLRCRALLPQGADTNPNSKVEGRCWFSGMTSWIPPMYLRRRYGRKEHAS